MEKKENIVKDAYTKIDNTCCVNSPHLLFDSQKEMDEADKNEVFDCKDIDDMTHSLDILENASSLINLIIKNKLLYIYRSHDKNYYLCSNGGYESVEKRITKKQAQAFHNIGLSSYDYAESKLKQLKDF